MNKRWIILISAVSVLAILIATFLISFLWDKSKWWFFGTLIFFVFTTLIVITIIYIRTRKGKKEEKEEVFKERINLDQAEEMVKKDIKNNLEYADNPIILSKIKINIGEPRSPFGKVRGRLYYDDKLFYGLVNLHTPTTPNIFIQRDKEEEEQFEKRVKEEIQELPEEPESFERVEKEEPTGEFHPITGLPIMKKEIRTKKKSEIKKEKEEKEKEEAETVD